MSQPPEIIHGMVWEQALADVPPKASTAERDAVVADWAQRCWQDLRTALPGRSHSVVAYPGQTGERVRSYIITPHATGWLHAPQTAQADAPRWGRNSANVLLGMAREAMLRGFCAADALVLGNAACLAASAQGTPIPEDFARQRRFFPLLGPPRHTAFAPMPASMLHSGHPYGLYAVMDNADAAVRCMQAGVRLVQLRMKDPAPQALDAAIVQCANAAHQHGALFIVNDHWRAALRHAQQGRAIYGVHLGQEDLLSVSETDLDALQASQLRIGISSHSLWEVARALRIRPSYLACGPVHATTTKVMPWLPLGEHNVACWADWAHSAAGQGDPAIPLVAIGGLNVPRAHAAAAAGADSIAVVSAITGASDAAQAIHDLQQAIAQGHAARDIHRRPQQEWPQPTVPAG